MTRSGAPSMVLPQPLGLADSRFYLATGALVVGNLLFPLLVHRIPDAGRTLLPIFFFTLIAGWRYGVKVGLLTGLLSPLANHFVTGMPPAALLRELLLQSALLGVLASLVASRGRRASLALLALVVGMHQALVLFPQLLQGSAGACFETFRLRLPGLLLQILGGTALLRLLPTPPRTLDGNREG